MSKVTLLLFLSAAVFGIFLVVFGGYDDSPGAQLLGLMAASVGIIGIVQTIRKRK